jgi:hypothetical protein
LVARDCADHLPVISFANEESDKLR